MIIRTSWHHPALAIACLAVGACLPAGGGVTPFATATAALVPFQPGSQPAASDLALSCREIEERLFRLHDRFSEPEMQEAVARRQAAVASAAVDGGLAVLGGRLTGLAGGGGLTGLRAAATAVSAVQAVALAESSGPDLRQVTSATAIATRAAVLERAQLEKGC